MLKLDTAAGFFSFNTSERFVVIDFLLSLRLSHIFIIVKPSSSLPKVVAIENGIFHAFACWPLSDKTTEL